MHAGQRCKPSSNVPDLPGTSAHTTPHRCHVFVSTHTTVQAHPSRNLPHCVAPTLCCVVHPPQRLARTPSCAVLCTYHAILGALRDDVVQADGLVVHPEVNILKHPAQAVPQQGRAIFSSCGMAAWHSNCVVSSRQRHRRSAWRLKVCAAVFSAVAAQHGRWQPHGPA